MRVDAPTGVIGGTLETSKVSDDALGLQSSARIITVYEPTSSGSGRLATTVFSSSLLVGRSALRQRHAIAAAVHDKVERSGGAPVISPRVSSAAFTNMPSVGEELERLRGTSTSMRLGRMWTGRSAAAIAKLLFLREAIRVSQSRTSTTRDSRAAFGHASSSDIPPESRKLGACKFRMKCRLNARPDFEWMVMVMVINSALVRTHQLPIL